MANVGGGRIILGVNDRREVVGGAAFPNLDRMRQDQGNRLHMNIEADEVLHANGRVVVVTVPSRPIGLPIQYQGAYWMRRGEELVAMPPEALREIFDEAQPDDSARICPGASVEDLSAEAVERFRGMWQRASGNATLRKMCSRGCPATRFTGCCAACAMKARFVSRVAPARQGGLPTPEERLLGPRRGSPRRNRHAIDHAIRNRHPNGIYLFEIKCVFTAYTLRPKRRSESDCPRAAGADLARWTSCAGGY